MFAAGAYTLHRKGEGDDHSLFSVKSVSLSNGKLNIEAEFYTSVNSLVEMFNL